MPKPKVENYERWFKSMNVIISKSVVDNFNSFVVIDSLKKATELSGVTTIIIHSYVENDFDAGVFISRLRETGVSQFFYITANPSTTMRMLISGVKGYFTEDEFYFDDEEELIALLEDITENEDSSSDETTSLAAPSLNVVSDFIEAFVRGDKLISAPLYLERVKQAVVDLSKVTQQQELQITAMGNSAIEVFEKASQIIINMDKQRKLIEQKLDELQEIQVTTPSRPNLENSINFFSPYKYIGNSKVILFREYAPTRYFTSFILGYAHYLHYTRNKRIKLVFTIQRSAGVAAKYSDFPMISQESMNISSLYDAEIVVTNNPKKEVMKELLGKSNEIVIVADRLYGSQDIVSGRIQRVAIASSRSDIQRYKLKPEETIFSVTAQPKQLFCLSTIKQFPIEEDARYAAYYQCFGKMYEMLDKKFDI